MAKAVTKKQTPCERPNQRLDKHPLLNNTDSTDLMKVLPVEAEYTGFYDIKGQMAFLKESPISASRMEITQFLGRSTFMSKKVIDLNHEMTKLEPLVECHVQLNESTLAVLWNYNAAEILYHALIKDLSLTKPKVKKNTTSTFNFKILVDGWGETRNEDIIVDENGCISRKTQSLDFKPRRTKKNK